MRITLPWIEGAGGRAHKGLDQRFCHLPSLKLMTGPLVHQRTKLVSGQTGTCDKVVLQLFYLNIGN